MGPGGSFFCREAKSREAKKRAGDCILRVFHPRWKRDGGRLTIFYDFLFPILKKITNKTAPEH
jgi:hypothetical protein